MVRTGFVPIFILIGTLLLAVGAYAVNQKLSSLENIESPNRSFTDKFADILKGSNRSEPEKLLPSPNSSAATGGIPFNSSPAIGSQSTNTPSAQNTNTPVSSPVSNVFPSNGADTPASNAILVKVLVLKFLPAGRVQNYDIDDLDSRIISKWESGTRYHGYKDSNAKQSIKFSIVETIVDTNSVPQKNSNDWPKADYEAIFSKHNLCAKAKEKDIKQIWLWADGTGGFAESAVAGNRGVTTNGPSISACNDKTIVVFGFNYERDWDMAMESISHHLETVIGKYRGEWSRWKGFKPQDSNNARCGDAHFPPNNNLSEEYLTDISRYVSSDCEDWKPDGSGQKMQINCARWGCSGGGRDKVGEFRGAYLVWWMQNMPGSGNSLYDSGNKVPNWWGYIADPERCISDSLSSYCSAQ